MVGRSVKPWVAAILTLLGAACGTIDRMEQAHRDAKVRERQNEEAVARNTASKADHAQRVKQLQESARLRRLQSELIAQGDPDSLAAAALVENLISGFTNSTALELAARAGAGAPDRADLALVQLQLCENDPSCDALPLETRLRQLDPQNGIAWTYALLRADRQSRPADWEAARGGLAQSRRVDLYWNRTVSRLAKAVAGKAGFDANAAVVQVIGIEAALMSALQPLSKACQAQELQRPDVLEQCRQIAAALRRGDTGLVEAYGSSLAIRLWPEGSAEYQEVLSERRALRYRADVTTRYAAQLNSPQAIHALTGFLAQYPTEQTALRALYVHLGLQPDAPDGWADPRPGG